MDFLIKDLLLVMMLGNTHYIDVGKDQPAIIYYEDEDSAHMRFPNGKSVEGVWRMTESGYYVDWENGPAGEWRIARDQGRMFYVDSKGTDRGNISKIVPGDAADLSE